VGDESSGVLALWAAMLSPRVDCFLPEEAVVTMHDSHHWVDKLAHPPDLKQLHTVDA